MFETAGPPGERTISQQGEIFSEIGTAKKSWSWHCNLKDTDPEVENENASVHFSDTISDSNCTSPKHSVVISESATPLSGADDEMSDEESVKAQNRRKSSVLLVPEKRSRHSRRHERGNCSNSFLFSGRRVFATIENGETQGDVPGNRLNNFLRHLLKDLAGTIASVIVSHPFMVVTARMCAQFVGRESLYTGIRSSFRDIFLREGIQGLFAGITPRLIGEALVVVISGPLATAINRSNQFVEPRWIRRFASFSFRVKFSFNSVVSF
ncbi:hypothetical protein QYM36_005596 [Artemia franciscana]|uniref:Mitochondrial carrier protein n=1 Tax=Artemia franciscana TaxID=6661 RepID=A0AA88IBQ3_ARTSF|nr:hypothetical protein QYM36_005596 [Artemia franciscana]